MLKKEVLATIAFFIILLPIAIAFEGSGEGYDVFGVTGAGAGSGTGDGYDIYVTTTGEPAGSGTGDGYSLAGGMFFAEPEEEPPSGGSVGGCQDQCASGDIKCVGSYVLEICQYSVQEGCWKYAASQCQDGYICENAECIPAPCVEDWVCDAWSECEDGIQARECYEWAHCGTDYEKPNDKKECIEEEEVGAEEELAPVIEAPPAEPVIEEPSVIFSPERVLSVVWIVLGALVLIAIAVEIMHGISIKRGAAPPTAPETGLYYVKDKHVMDINSELKKFNENLKRLKRR